MTNFIMKLLGLFVFVFCNTLFCIACQPFESQVVVNYDMYVMYESIPYFSATLNCNSSQSLYTFVQRGESPNAQFKSKMSKGGDYGNYILKTDTTINMVYLDKYDNILLDTRPDIKIRGIVTIDTIPYIKWIFIKDSIKQIGSYKCYMAKGKFRGSVYTVWYTVEIPVSFGPWKLNGCPGLILEATRNDNGLCFYATKIDNGKKIVDFNINKYSGKTISYTEYRQSRIDAINKMCEKIAGQRSRSATNVAVPFYISCMECDFIDEIKRYPSISIRQASNTSIPVVDEKNKQP